MLCIIFFTVVKGAIVTYTKLLFCNSRIPYKNAILNVGNFKNEYNNSILFDLLLLYLHGDLGNAVLLSNIDFSSKNAQIFILSSVVNGISSARLWQLYYIISIQASITPRCHRPFRIRPSLPLETYKDRKDSAPQMKQYKYDLYR